MYFINTCAGFVHILTLVFYAHHKWRYFFFYFIRTILKRSF